MDSAAEWIKIWNQRHGTTLPLSVGLLERTFFSVGPERYRVAQTPQYLILTTVEPGKLRVHLIVEKSIKSGGSNTIEIIKYLDEQARELGAPRILFGGGEPHLFPGVPLCDSEKKWLEYFQPSGPVVWDFLADLESLKLETGDTSDWKLSSPKTKNAETQLLEFVAQEFGGRWEREIAHDFSHGQGEHYFSFENDGKIIGYVRLYGWRDDYWAPGVYFSGPGRGVGGLGPIGVASSQRGLGFGTTLLRESLIFLKQKGLKTVRIDWTTEKKFYEQMGLRGIQSYQPAVRNVS
ncbi:MAG: GNAT family N-acetyltransferase [Oligoflexia bacterium]|nr:GNAT family N-acetyltransferase [Oligoflexia bacterium]